MKFYGWVCTNWLSYATVIYYRFPMRQPPCTAIENVERDRLKKLGFSKIEKNQGENIKETLVSDFNNNKFLYITKTIAPDVFRPTDDGRVYMKFRVRDNFSDFLAGVEVSKKPETATFDIGGEDIVEWPKNTFIYPRISGTRLPFGFCQTYQFPLGLVQYHEITIKLCYTSIDDAQKALLIVEYCILNDQMKSKFLETSSKKPLELFEPPNIVSIQDNLAYMIR